MTGLSPGEPSPAPTTLIVVRHGRTAGTEAGRFAGRDGADAALSDAGRQDADRLASALAGLGGPGAAVPDVGPPTVVVTSPMARTRQTAEVAAAALGAGAGPPQVVVDEGWVEASFGGWENLTFAEVGRRYPADLTAWLGSTTLAPHGGDRLVDVAARVRRARRTLVESRPAECVLVVTHLTCVRAVVQEAFGASDEAMWRARITPGALTAVRYWADGGVEVLTVNSTAHLGSA